MICKEKIPKFKFVFDEITVRIVYCCITGLHSLVYDNVTEHPDTINVLERMNVYQEVVLSVLYRILPIKVCFKFLYLSSLQSFASQLMPLIFTTLHHQGTFST